jgi:hypothetical protein
MLGGCKFNSRVRIRARDNRNPFLFCQLAKSPRCEYSDFPPNQAAGFGRRQLLLIVLAVGIYFRLEVHDESKLQG